MLWFFFYSNESEAIKAIVAKVTGLLKKTNLVISDKPVGIEFQVRYMNQLLDILLSDDVQLLGIYNDMGRNFKRRGDKGLNAKDIYNEMGCNFKGMSLLAKIRRKVLEEQLMPPSIDSKKIILKDRLSDTRVILEIDSVNELEQLVIC